VANSDQIISRIKDASGGNSIISRDALTSVFQDISPNISDTAVRNRIFNYIRRGILAQVTNGHFTLDVKANWNPVSSDGLNAAWKVLSGDYRENHFCLWSTKWINEFINLQAFNEVLFIEAEHIVAQSVYFKLAEKYNGVFFSPGEKEIDFYIAGKQKSYVIRPLITRAPLINPVPFTLTGKKRPVPERRLPIPRIEKLLTDVYYDKNLLSAWKYEEEKIWQDAYSRYNINFSTVYNYAQRRDSSVKIIDFLISTINSLPNDIVRFFKER